MKLQVLVATVDQTDYSLLEKMNIRTEAIIGNQCNRDEIQRFKHRDKEILWLSFNERGVGLNRNNALMRANGDICLFSDDDVVYCDDYENTIITAFNNNPKADIIIFNLQEVRKGQPLKDKVKKSCFVGRKGISAYGAVTVAARVEKLKLKNVYFHRMFGGGAEYSCGEDTIFLTDCIKNGLRVYTCCSTIGWVKYDQESTWFRGYNDKFFMDKGLLYKYLYPKIARLLSIYHVVKHRDRYLKFGVRKAIQMMIKGTQQI